MPPYVGLNGKTRWRLHTMYLRSNADVSPDEAFYTSKTLTSAPPPYSSKEIARNCY